MAQKNLSPNRALGYMILVFLGAYFIPFDAPRVSTALHEAFCMLSDYARQHVLLCVVPALFIAGAITVFLNQRSVIRYLGPTAPKPLAYGVASVSGAILAVCSCTVLPLFKGIYKKGAGLGAAIAFLYSGPAINILAIVMSYKVLGWKLGLARMLGAILFSITIGFIMQILFRKEDEQRLLDEQMFSYTKDESERSLVQMVVYMFSMIGILIFVNWARSQGSFSWWDTIYSIKYWITGGFVVVLLYSLIRWFTKDDIQMWMVATRDFALQILPLLFAGVLLAGFLLGRPGHEALIPSSWIHRLVGGNSLLANFIAAFAGAFMYFATLTEVPIVQGLLGNGMGQGPALALLLAGPSLSLPSMLVIWGELGTKKTITYVSLVVLLSTLVGFGFGMIG
ncbi:MAG: permease [Treponemataceae bacterium]|nr:permease [Treponemataceae bacterium]